MCQFARPCQWDLRHVRASIAKMLRLSCNLRLSRLQKCCACHEISPHAARVPRLPPHFDHPSNKVLRLPTGVANTARLRANGPGSETAPCPSSRRRRGSFQPGDRRGSLSHSYTTAQRMFSPTHSLFLHLSCAQDYLHFVSVTRKFLLNFLWLCPVVCCFRIVLVSFPFCLFVCLFGWLICLFVCASLFRCFVCCLLFVLLRVSSVCCGVALCLVMCSC